MIGAQQLSIDALHDAGALRRGAMLTLIEGYPPLAGSDATEALHELLALFVEPNLRIDVETTQRLRSDEPTEPNQRERFQRIAPATEEGLYLVPKVIE